MLTLLHNNFSHFRAFVRAYDFDEHFPTQFHINIDFATEAKKKRNGTADTSFGNDDLPF